MQAELCAVMEGRAPSLPEDLGRRIRVVDGKGLFAALTGLAMLAGILVWSLAGAIPELVAGQGMIVPPAGLMNVNALAPGQITDVFVAPGTRVKRGDVVAKVAAYALENDRLRILAELEGARAALAERTAYFDQTIALKSRNDQEKASAIRFRKASLGEYVAFLKTYVGGLDKLEKGMMRPKEIEDTRSNMYKTMSDVADCDIKLAEIDSTMLELRSQAALDILQRRQKVAELELALENAERQLAVASQVVSPFDGTVVELMGEQGDVAQAGMTVVTLEPEEPEIKATILLPAQTGKKVKPGMAAYVSPSTAQKEEYGCIYGVVTEVSAFPASMEGMVKSIGATQFIQSLVSSGQGVVISVEVALLRDPATPTGYQWSSSQGPSGVRIEPGTLCSGEVVVKRRKPLELVFPKLARILGLAEG